MASDSKDSHGDIQLVVAKVSQDCGGQPVQVTALSEWATTRKELWCFYLYFVVRDLLLLFDFHMFAF